jgi:hypothetical protein
MRSAVWRRVIILGITGLFSVPAQGQFLDTIRASFRVKPKFLFLLDTYNSFVSSEGANTFGLRAGLEFNKRVRISAGYYNLVSDIVKRKTVTDVFPNDTSLNARLDMNYFPVCFEYVFYNKYPWELSVPLNIGAGKSYFWYYRNAAGEQGRIDEKTVVLGIVSAGAQYKIMKWFGVGAGLGYRVMLVDNSNINENFNSVIYSLNLRIFLDEVAKSLFSKKQEAPSP